MRPTGVAALTGLALAAAVACSGLLVDKANAYPCDFSAAESVRDLACPGGSVCAVSNLCQRFVYEGPQFEGAPPLPALGQGRQVSPVVLKGPVRTVLPNVGADPTLVITSAQDGGIVLVAQGLTALAPIPWPGPIPSVGALLGSGSAVVRVEGVAGEAQVVNGSAPPQPVLALVGSAKAAGFEAFRVGGLPDGGVKVGLVGKDLVGPVGELLAPGETGGAVYRYRPFALLLDGGSDGLPSPRDMRWVSRSVLEPRRLTLTDADPTVPLVVTQQGFYYRQRRAAADFPGQDLWLRLNPDDDLSLRPIGVTAIRLSRGSSVLAVAARSSGLVDELQVLSTWRLTRDSNGPRLDRAWSDCTPCGAGKILTFTPGLDGTGLFVDVLCEQRAGGLGLLRVQGSFALDPTRACQQTALLAPFDLSEVASTATGPGLTPKRGYAIDTTVGDFAAIGGVHGQLWRGPELSTLSALYLDRAPLSFGSIDVPVDGGAPRAVALALTDDQLAAPISQNGYAAFELAQVSEEPLPAGVAARAGVGEASGWLVLSSGDLAVLTPRSDAGSTAPVQLQFGPRLLDGRAVPAPGPYQAEALTGVDGGLTAMVVTADDSLYFWASPPAPTAAANALPALTAQLTPEPSFPIRSMTLERSGLATDGIHTARGYLVTSRNLYTFTLSGQPPRWNAHPVALSAGEPVEVWMDHPKGGLGRVGYRDGAVFTLPGGFPLVQPLAGGDDAGVDRVLDYENLGGWPVALAESGLYVAYWDLLPSGKLDNKYQDGGVGKPMGWRKVTLADGSEPWRGGRGRLSVRRRSAEVDAGTLYTPYVLSLFGEHGEVYELGTLTRQNLVR